MQLVRKSKTVQQDKLRSLPTCYLANMLQDYFHNSVKHKVDSYCFTDVMVSYFKEQIRRYQAMKGFKCVTRDELTHRGILHFQE